MLQLSDVPAASTPHEFCSLFTLESWHLCSWLKRLHQSKVSWIWVILSYYSKLVDPQMRCELHLGPFPHRMLSLTRVNTASGTVWSKASLRITYSDQPIHHPPGFLQIYRRFAPQQKGQASKWQHHVQVFCEGSGGQENPRVSWIRMANDTYSKLGGWFIHSQKLHF